MRPAETSSGITFRRVDLPNGSEIKATSLNVSDTTLATTLGTNGTRVATVEHLLSAFFGLGICNAHIEIDSFEIPIMDGSALPFMELIECAGIEAQDRPKNCLVITRPISVSDGDGEAMLLPSSRFEITYTIDFPHPVIGRQSYHMVFGRERYAAEISQARTFGFLKEVEVLQAKGLALGGSLKNAIVLDDEKVINKEGLRCSDEFVKHKILDAVGDLSLLGMPIIGHFVAYKSGHRLNNLLLRSLLMDESRYQVIDHIDELEGLRGEMDRLSKAVRYEERVFQY